MNPDAQELRADIARTRAELGETVEEIVARTDVKARLSRTAADPAVRRRFAGIAAIAGLVVAGLIAIKVLVARRAR